MPAQAPMPLHMAEFGRECKGRHVAAQQNRGRKRRLRSLAGIITTNAAFHLGTGDEGRAEGTRAPPRDRPHGRRQGAHRRPAQEGQAHRPRAHRGLPRRRLVRGVRHVCRAPLDRFRHGEDQDRRRRRRHRLGHGQRPPGLSLRQGFYRLRRLAVGSACREGGQGAGDGAAQPRADHRPLRRRRRPHPGRRGGTWRLCRDFPAQRAGLRRHPADLR